METITRNTKETQIQASLEVYGKGIAKIQTGIGFFNHMLESLCKHAYWDLTLECKGDLEVDYHHSVEDCGIVIGELLKKNLFPIQKIERFGNSAVVMDESCVECDLDISNRPFLVFAGFVVANSTFIYLTSLKPFLLHSHNGVCISIGLYLVSLNSSFHLSTTISCTSLLFSSSSFISPSLCVA